jgi:hypothetical protein
MLIVTALFVFSIQSAISSKQETAFEPKYSIPRIMKYNAHTNEYVGHVQGSLIMHVACLVLFVCQLFQWKTTSFISTHVTSTFHLKARSTLARSYLPIRMFTFRRLTLEIKLYFVQFIRHRISARAELSFFITPLTLRFV